MKPLHAGKLRSRVLFENPNLTKDASGSQVPGTPTQYPVWANVESPSGGFGARREFEAASQEWGGNIKLLRVRYATPLMAADTSWRVRIDGVWHNILTPAEDVDAKHSEISFVAGAVR